MNTYDPVIFVYCIIGMLILSPFYGLYKTVYPDPPNPWSVVRNEITSHCLTTSRGDRVRRSLTDKHVFYCKETGKYLSRTKAVYVVDTRTVPYKYRVK